MSEYNGWSNYETWLIAVEVINDYADSLEKDGQLFASVSELETYFQDHAESLVSDDASGTYAESLALTLLSSVNWQELAEEHPELLATECESCGDLVQLGTLDDNDLCEDCAELEEETA